MLNVEIAAARTMRVAFQDGRHTPCLKSSIAVVAPPGPQACSTDHEVEYTVTVRAITIDAATLGTNHRRSEAVAENTEKPVNRQGGRNTTCARLTSSNRDVAVTFPEQRRSPSGMDIPPLLGDNFAQIMRLV